MSAIFSVLKFSDTDSCNKKWHFEVVPEIEQHAFIKRKQFSGMRYVKEKNVSNTIVLKTGCGASIDIEVDKVKCATLKYDASTRGYKHDPVLNVTQGQHVVFKLGAQIIYEDTMASGESGVCEKLHTIQEPMIVPEKVIEYPEVLPMSPRANPANGEGFAENYGHDGNDPGPTSLAPRPSPVHPVPSSPPFVAIQQPALGLEPVIDGVAQYPLSNVFPQMPMPESIQPPYTPQGPPYHAFPVDQEPRPLGFEFVQPQNHYQLPRIHDIPQYVQYFNQIFYRKFTQF
ncbi:hypothetical protein DPMN_009448 [Dreissena polymorpha]|uniref:Uncharacterized protein n=1 Tax=Dreissena polymorpha TaxID=45954 RepID=A0A9D4N194_DREPO|nr:hypothetical protein DPMN_009448 [Dreissena polymorpha]